ncbi:MAG: hypothetical protein ABJB97_08175, partial [Acidobacteriota bacterium]
SFPSRSSRRRRTPHSRRDCAKSTGRSWAGPAGCLDWREHGLTVPARVLAETNSYFETQDLFQQWLDQECDTGRQLADSNARLFASWAEFCEAAGEPVGSGRTHADRLAEHGFQRIKDSNAIRGRGFLGLRVKPNADEYRFASNGE